MTRPTRTALLASAPASVQRRNPPPVAPVAPPAPAKRPGRGSARPATPDARTGALDAAGVVVVEVPGLRLVSEANRASHEHWRKRSSRAAAQHARMAVALAAVRRPALPLRVCVTSFGPGTKDDDNAAGCAKYVRDAIARWLRVDDADPRVLWRVVQQKGPVGVRVTLAPLPALRSTVDAGEAADVVTLRVTREALGRWADAALAGDGATLDAGGVLVVAEMTEARR